MEDDAKKELEQKYMEMQIIDQQMKQIQKQLQAVANQVIDLRSAKDGLADLECQKVGTKSFVPFSSGIYLKASMVDCKNLLVNVGANIAVEKTVEETKDMLDQQMKEMDGLRDKLLFNLQSISIRAKELEGELSKLIQ